jgi:NTE family protein
MGRGGSREESPLAESSHGNGVAQPRRETGVTLVLGGGGARGLAHLGVLRVLEAEGIPIRSVVGNSAGAIMAAAWLQQESAEKAIRHILAFQYSPSFQRLGLSFHPHRRGDGRARSFVGRVLSGWRSQVAMHLLFRRASLFHRKRLEILVGAAVRPGRLEELRLPLHVVALDIASGEQVVLDRGDLRTILTASASVAGFFPPVEVDGRPLIDSGLADNLPVVAARERCGGPIVAVNLSCNLDARYDCLTGIEALLRSEELASRFNNRQRAELADVRVEPRVGTRYWLDFSEPESIVAAGEAAARESLAAIRRLVPAPAPAH